MNAERRTISASTAWSAYRHKSGRKMARELLGLGFDAIELNVHVTQQMIEDIHKMVKRGEIRISSLHNYCPLHEGMDPELAAGNAFPLSSTDKDEHAEAVLRATKTIQWAGRLKASAVVFHLGLAPIEVHQREILLLIGAGFREQAQELIAEALVERAKIYRPYLDAVISALQELSIHAEDEGVKLGLETRYCFYEIPTFDEFETIFESVSSPAVGYWHDTGHAHTMEHLGIAKQEDFLRRYGDRLVGMHIHDAVGASDHRAVGRGEIDFPAIIPYIKPDTVLVLEMHSHVSDKELARSKEAFQRLLIQG